MFHQLFWSIRPQLMNTILRTQSTKASYNNLKFDEQASLYVHWPYCAKRCTYCNFNKYISKHVDNTRMTKCLVTELNTLLEISGIQRINSIFFGGGTPSLADPTTIESILLSVQDQVQLQSGAEVTLEVNPTHLEASKLRDFRLAGINRVSIGVQSLIDEDLMLLGREHSSIEAIRSVDTAKQMYPGSVSIDVIFGRPGQTVKQWTEELQKVLSLCDNHVSLYQLTLERGTQLFKWVTEKRLTMPDSDTMADMYSTAIELLESSGLLQYEVSNFAKKGSESTHNQAYWEGMQYIGIGPGSHGRFIPKALGLTQRESRIQTLEPNVWMLEVEKFKHGTRKRIALSDLDILQELLMTGLRMTKGISHQMWCQHCSHASFHSIFESHDDIQILIDEKLLELDGSSSSPKGQEAKGPASIVRLLTFALKLLLLKNQWANYNQTWHIASHVKPHKVCERKRDRTNRGPKRVQKGPKLEA